MLYYIQLLLNYYIYNVVPNMGAISCMSLILTKPVK